jgi:hypothetical protein
MYGWGGDTSNWRGSRRYKFDSARSPYLDKLASAAAKKGPRTYTRSHEPDMALVNSRGKNLKSDSKNPIVVAVDVTGSMASWPGEIFDRLPLLYQTLSQYREDAEFCFAAIGDATCDEFPLQVNDFGKGLDLEQHVKALGCEGGGGGQVSESYELFAHFMLNHCETPNATSPFLLIYGDEKFYNEVDPRQVEHYIGDKLQAPVDSKGVWKGLMQKFNMYFLHKPYGHGGDTRTDREVVAHWADAIGEQRIIEIPTCERAVDIAMGIVAKQWGQFGDFKENLGARQSKKSVKDSVYKSLRFIPDAPSSKSVMATSKRGKTKSLSTMFDDAKK